MACFLYCTQSDRCCIDCCSSCFGVNLHNPPTNGKKGPIPEEMSQTLLTNKKQGNWDMPQTLLIQQKLALTARNTLYALYNHWSSLKTKKIASPLCRPRNKNTCHQKPNPSHETIPLKNMFSVYICTFLISCKQLLKVYSIFRPFWSGTTVQRPPSVGLISCKYYSIKSNVINVI